VLALTVVWVLEHYKVIDLSSLPLNLVLDRLLYEPNTFKNICDVIYSSLLNVQLIRCII